MDRFLPPSSRGLGGLYAQAMRTLPLWYLVWAVVTGTMLAWVTPAWQNPDEPTQVQRVVQISLGGLLGRRNGGSAGGITDHGIDVSWAATSAMPGHSDVKLTASMRRQSEAARWGHTGWSAFANTATYPPFLYAAAIPAAWIGRHTRMHVAATLRLMRLFDALAAAALGAVALAVARRTRLAIAAVLLLPMSVALAASPSQDALLIPLAALAVAAVDRARAAPQPGSGEAPAFWVAAALLPVILARPPYLPLAILVLLLSGARVQLRVWLMLGIVVLTLTWSAYVSLRIAVPMNGALPALQAAFLLHHPLGFAETLGRTLAQQGRFYADTMIGVLGWLDAWPPDAFFRFAWLVLALATASAAAPDSAAATSWWLHRTPLGLLAVLGCAAGLFVSLYVIWSAPAAAAIEGVQGRYFLPLLPALALAMPSIGRAAAMLRPLALVAVLVLAVVAPVVSLTTLVARYYLAA